MSVSILREMRDSVSYGILAESTKSMFLINAILGGNYIVTNSHVTQTILQTNFVISYNIYVSVKTYILYERDNTHRDD
jgi:hypothetical protein